MNKQVRIIAAQGLLETILDQTTNGDHRAIAQNHVVQLATKEPTDAQLIECESFIERALAIEA